MKADINGQNFIKNFEGLKLNPYKCSAGVPTIGYGTTVYPNGVKVTMKDNPITKEQANEYFLHDLSKFEKDLCFLLGKKLEEINQNKFNALLSFGYNLGMDIDVDSIPEGLGDSTLLKKVLANPNDPTIRGQFLLWNKANGKVVNGLTIRRAAEAELYFKK